MPFASLGPETSGSRLAEQDSIANFVAIAKGNQLQAQAEQEQMKTEQARREIQALSQLKTPDGRGGPGAGGKLSDLPRSFGEQLMQMGATTTGAKLLHTASQIDSEEAQAGAARALEVERKGKAIGESAQAAGNLAGVIRNERDWQAAGMMMAQRYPDMPNPFRGPFDPSALPIIKQSAMDAKSRAEVAVRQAAVGVQRDVGNARISYLKGRLQQHNVELEINAEREERLGKEGGMAGRGRPVGAPSKAEMDMAFDLVNGQMPDALSKETAQQVVNIVASEGRALAAANRGMSVDQAQRKVLADLQKDGSFQDEADWMSGAKTAVGMAPKKVLVYGGRSAEDPLPAEKNTKFIPGRYYKSPGGIVKEYRADGKFYAPEAKPAGATPPSRLSAVKDLIKKYNDQLDNEED